MAGNISEADERIIQLLAALNATLGSYAASQESDTSDSLANQLSSTALVVSLIALIVALLQAVLEYVSSNSAKGDKCNAGAIGKYARVSRTRRWSWRHWRRQYFYPEFDLDPMELQFSVHDCKRSEVGKIFEELEGLVTTSLTSYEGLRRMNNDKTKWYSWRYHPDLESKRFDKEDRPQNLIRNGRHYLFRKQGEKWVTVLSQDLPMKYRLKWFYYCVSHGRANKTTPRATWAQLLTLLNVDPMMIEPSRLVDANCIPSSLDVPSQKVKLTDLGCYAFCLGFKHVKIDTEAREITATGEIGTITTETMPGFGAVVRLQVSSPKPQHLVVDSPDLFWEVIYHRGQLLGRFIFGRVGIGIETVDFILGRKSVNPTGTTEEVNRWLQITAKGCKHERPEASDNDLCLDCLAEWQPLAGGKHWPSILLAASAASIPRITTGFPSSVFLGPFLRVFQRLAHSLSARRGVIWTQYNLDNLREGTMVLELLQHDLLRVTGHEYLTYGGALGEGHLSWMRDVSDLREVEVIEDILLSRLSARDARAELRYAALFAYWDPPPAFLIHESQTSGREVRNTSDPVNPESLTEGRLMPYIVDLLDNFDPVPWGIAMRAQIPPPDVHAENKGGWRNNVQPHNVLWTQTFLLDLAIIKSCLQHTTSINAVSQALVESWEEPWDPASKTTSPLQNLHQFLYRNAFKDQTSEDIPEEARDLADMIKARMLCYIAYMMVIPDSTSLYKASMEDPVVLPMI